VDLREHLLEHVHHDRFIAGNRELREILRRAEGLENADCRVTEEDLKIIRDRLLNVTPEIGEASRSVTLDADLQDQVAEYVKNLRALLHVMEKIRCNPGDRRVPSEAENRRINDLRVWVQEYLQYAWPDRPDEAYRPSKHS
jgi:hypothetical protein